MSLKHIRRAVSYQLERHWTGDPIPTEHIAVVLLALDGLMLLRPLNEDPEPWVAKVNAARREALDQVIRDGAE